MSMFKQVLSALRCPVFFSGHQVSISHLALLLSFLSACSRWRRTSKVWSWNTQKPLCKTRGKYKHSNASIFNSTILDHSQNGWEKAEGSREDPSQEGSVGGGRAAHLWAYRLAHKESWLLSQTVNRNGDYSGNLLFKKKNWWVLLAANRNLSGWGSRAEDVYV